MLRVLITGAFGAIAALIVVAGVYLYRYERPETLRIENRTDATASIYIPTFERFDIAPNSSRTISTGWFHFDWERMEVNGAYACDWDDARKHQPLIIDDRGVHCDGSVR